MFAWRELAFDDRSIVRVGKGRGEGGNEGGAFFACDGLFYISSSIAKFCKSVPLISLFQESFVIVSMLLCCVFACCAHEHTDRQTYTCVKVAQISQEGGGELKEAAAEGGD